MLRQMSPEHSPDDRMSRTGRRMRWGVSPSRSPAASAHPRRPRTAGFCGRQSIGAVHRFPAGNHCKSAGSRPSRRGAFPCATEGWIGRPSARPPHRQASREGQRRLYEATSLPPSATPPSGAERMIAAPTMGSIMVRRRGDNNRRRITRTSICRRHVGPVERDAKFGHRPWQRFSPVKLGGFRQAHMFLI